MTPNGPCFSVGPRGYFSFDPNFSSQRKATLLGAINGFFTKTTIYDGEGQKWQAKGIDSIYKRNWWTILLANTVCNPVINVSVLWGEPKTYVFEELKRAYIKAVEKDDDILTQFVEANELKTRISSAQSFRELTEIYLWMQTDHSDED